MSYAICEVSTLGETGPVWLDLIFAAAALPNDGIRDLSTTRRRNSNDRASWLAIRVMESDGAGTLTRLKSLRREIVDPAIVEHSMSRGLGRRNRADSTNSILSELVRALASSSSHVDTLLEGKMV
jgi:hypothetical protein